MNTLRSTTIIGLMSFLCISSAFAEDIQQKTVTPWNKSRVAPPDVGRYPAATPEQSAEFKRQMALIYPASGPSSPVSFPEEHEFKVTAAEHGALKNLTNRKVEAIIRPEFFPPATVELTTFHHRKKPDDTQRPRSLIFHISYKINGYRIVINGGVANMKVESIRVFIGRENEYPVAEEVFKIAPTTLTRENIRVREGATLKIQEKAETIELKGLAAEFRDLK